MYPKMSSLLLVLVVTLTTTSTLCSAACNAKNLTVLLQNYKIPGSLFPRNVKNFSCVDIPGINNAQGLTIEFPGDTCNVKKQLWGLANEMEYNSVVTGIVFPRRLTAITGYTVKISYDNLPAIPVEVTEIRVSTSASNGAEAVRLHTDDDGVTSPLYPVQTMPDQGPLCEPVKKPSTRLAAINNNNNNNQDDELLKLVNKYGRILPLIAAASH